MIKKIDYASLNGELEEVLDKLQSGELDIDEAMEAYEKGLELVSELEKYLKTAENKVLKVSAQPKSSVGGKIVIWLLYALLVLIFVFSFVVFFGAPFLPTLKKQTTEALDLLDLKSGQTLLELGSGDGRILRAAAEQGIISIGYELNPFLYIFSMARSLKQRRFITIHFGSYWNRTLPPADGLYIFLLNRYMPKLDTKIMTDITKPLKVVSFAFPFPNRKPTKQKKGLMLYMFKPNK